MQVGSLRWEVRNWKACSSRMVNGMATVFVFFFFCSVKEMPLLNTLLLTKLIWPNSPETWKFTVSLVRAVPKAVWRDGSRACGR